MALRDGGSSPSWFPDFLSPITDQLFGNCGSPVPECFGFSLDNRGDYGIGDLVIVPPQAQWGAVVNVDNRREILPLQVRTRDGETRWFSALKLEPLQVGPELASRLRTEILEAHKADAANPQPRKYSSERGGDFILVENDFAGPLSGPAIGGQKKNRSKFAPEADTSDTGMSSEEQKKGRGATSAKSAAIGLSMASAAQALAKTSNTESVEKSEPAKAASAPEVPVVQEFKVESFADFENNEPADIDAEETLYEAGDQEEMDDEDDDGAERLYFADEDYEEEGEEEEDYEQNEEEQEFETLEDDWSQKATTSAVAAVEAAANATSANRMSSFDAMFPASPGGGVVDFAWPATPSSPQDNAGSAALVQGGSSGSVGGANPVATAPNASTIVLAEEDWDDFVFAQPCAPVQPVAGASDLVPAPAQELKPAPSEPLEVAQKAAPPLEVEPTPASPLEVAPTPALSLEAALTQGPPLEVLESPRVAQNSAVKGLTSEAAASMSVRSASRDLDNLLFDFDSRDTDGGGTGGAPLAGGVPTLSLGTPRANGCDTIEEAPLKSSRSVGAGSKGDAAASRVKELATLSTGKSANEGVENDDIFDDFVSGGCTGGLATGAGESAKVGSAAPGESPEVGRAGDANA